MKNILFSFLLVGLSVVLKAQHTTKGPLDGKTFTIDLYKEGKTKVYDSDELKFNLDKFKSKYFSNWGFTRATKYEITSVDSTSSDTKIYSWTTETISDIKEKMTWTGTVKGDEIEGTSEIVNAKGDTTYSFTFNGTLKGKHTKK